MDYKILKKKYFFLCEHIKMTDLVSNLSGLGGTTVGGISGWIEGQWSGRVVQVAVFAGVLHYITSSTAVIQIIKNAIPGFPTGSANLFNSVIYGVLLWVGIKFVFDPFIQAMAQNQEKLVEKTEGMR